MYNWFVNTRDSKGDWVAVMPNLTQAQAEFLALRLRHLYSDTEVRAESI